MSDVSIWHDLENDRDYVSGHGRRAEVDPIVTEAYMNEFAAYDAALKSENKQLRELVRDLHKALFTLDIDHCQACQRDSINGPCTKFMVRGSDECSIEEDMRELGIEVDV